MIRDYLLNMTYLTVLLLLSMTVYTVGLFSNDIYYTGIGYTAMVLTIVFISRETIKLFKVLDREIEHVEDVIYERDR